MSKEGLKGLLATEDWWAVWIGLGVFVLSLGSIAGLDALGWGVSTNVWLDITKAMTPVSKSYAALPGVASVFLTYAFLLAATSLGATVMNLGLRKFVIGFSIIFWVSYISWLAGNYAYIAATPDKLQSLKIPWSLGLTGEAGFIVALLAGLIIGNFLPKVAAFLKEATRPEWYIKTAIVILGAYLGVQAAGAMNIASAVMFRGFAAIIEAYLIYWALVYFIARRFFRFDREWAVPLASGISICGVAAAIATGAAIKARPMVPIMVSSLVVIFAVFELLVLPFAAQAFLYQQPLVASAWMGLAVKTDGAAVASGAITEGLVRAKALAESGVNFKEGWMLMTTTTVKVFIDVFIGIWAFVLSLIWVRSINKQPGEKVNLGQIWERFPKFVIGYFLTFLTLLILLIEVPGLQAGAKMAAAEANVFRVLFFVLTFFTIGLVTNFKKLWEEGVGKLALVYVVSLFGFVIWIGLAISFIFFNGILPPVG